MHSLAHYFTVFALFFLCAKFSFPTTHSSTGNDFFLQPTKKNQKGYG